ncbi:unnamed protein product, partial [Ectocarpus sp. 12 AP-2014]
SKDLVHFSIQRSSSQARYTLCCACLPWVVSSAWLIAGVRTLQRQTDALLFIIALYPSAQVPSPTQVVVACAPDGSLTSRCARPLPRHTRGVPGQRRGQGLPRGHRSGRRGGGVLGARQDSGAREAGGGGSGLQNVLSPCRRGAAGFSRKRERRACRHHAGPCDEHRSARGSCSLRRRVGSH